MRSVELIRARPTRPDYFHPRAVLPNFDKARIAVTIAHVDIVVRIPSNVGFPVECAHRPNRKALFPLFTAFDEFLEVVNSLWLSAKRHFDHATRVELDNHVRSLVNHPHIVVLIDANGVRE